MGAFSSEGTITPVRVVVFTAADPFLFVGSTKVGMSTKSSVPSEKRTLRRGLPVLLFNSLLSDFRVAEKAK